MTKINDGGPASPGAFDQPPGMTLRDYLAAHAPNGTDLVKFDNIGVASEITGITAPNMENSKEVLAFVFKLIAFLRYQYADAMLAARSGGQDDE